MKRRSGRPRTCVSRGSGRPIVPCAGSATEKRAVIRRAEELLAGVGLDKARGRCLFAAWATCVAAHEVLGRRFLLYAGTALWQRVERDDGVSPTHFGYKWEAPPGASVMIEEGRLPEMHVWCGDPKTIEVVDLCAGDFPSHCEQILGLGWEGPRPPDVLWSRADRLPAGAVYDASAEAGRLAARALAIVSGGG